MKPCIPGAPILPSAVTVSAIAVDDSIAQRDTADQAVRDGLITARVRMRLSASPLTNACGIHVEAFQGRVQLSGFVDTTAIRAAALGLARDVEGVQVVEDFLDTRKIDQRR